MSRAWLVLLAGCDKVFGIGAVGAAPPDAPPCTATIDVGMFAAREPVFTAETAPSLSLDQSLIYLSSGGVISYARDTGSGWSAPTAVPSLHADGYYEDRANLSYDKQRMLFTRHVAGTPNYDQPYESTRLDDAETWSEAVPIVYPSALSSNDVAFGIASQDNTRVMVASGLTNHYHLTELALVNGMWIALDTTRAFYPAGIDVTDSGAQLAPDGCWAVFTRIDHLVPPMTHVIMLALRGADGNFGAAVPLVTNMPGMNMEHPWLTPDGLRLYFHDGTTGVYSTDRE